MKTLYNIILKLGSYDELIIKEVELVDFLAIIPVLDRMKHIRLDSEQEFEIVIERVNQEVEAEYVEVE